MSEGDTERSSEKALPHAEWTGSGAIVVRMGGEGWREGREDRSPQTWPQDPSRSPGLALQFNLHEKSAPQTNSKAIS